MHENVASNVWENMAFNTYINTSPNICLNISASKIYIYIYICTLEMAAKADMAYKAQKAQPTAKDKV